MNNEDKFTPLILITSWLKKGCWNVFALSLNMVLSMNSPPEKSVTLSTAK